MVAQFFVPVSCPANSAFFRLSSIGRAAIPMPTASLSTTLSTGQVLSPELDDYRNIPCRIIASGGTHKRAILVAVARAGLATVVVTDADSAKAMLERR
ncbi:hypothetical protein BQ8794_130267 [Mesorhizobium prunaredense]|uniref:Sugar-binding domain-containing protein n=1 Tax=Mesorhizobium prunaredense TaxID=1631249 RepID=A0A1R3V1L6_9HYPH|nr:hypothetical protein BQ8794_130267 [Mesorhizobium prunaredense]